MANKVTNATTGKKPNKAAKQKQVPRNQAVKDVNAKTTGKTPPTMPNTQKELPPTIATQYPSKYPGDETLRLLIINNKGNKTLIARAAGVNRTTLYEWLDTRPEMVELCRKQYALGVDESLDKAEACIDRFITGIPRLNSRGEQTGWLLRPEYVPAMFKLKTQGKERGYVERVQTEQIKTDMPTINIMYRPDENNE